MPWISPIPEGRALANGIAYAFGGNTGVSGLLSRRLSSVVERDPEGTLSLGTVRCSDSRAAGNKKLAIEQRLWFSLPETTLAAVLALYWASVSRLAQFLQASAS